MGNGEKTQSHEYHRLAVEGASQVALLVKNLPATAGNIKDMNSIPGSERSPGRGHGNPLQYSCLENSMDRGARQAGPKELDRTEVT